MSTNRPSYFYKYFPQERFSDLTKCTFRFSPHDSFNDPFENAPAEPEKLDNLTEEETHALRSALNNLHVYSKELVARSLRTRFEAETQTTDIEAFQKRQGTLCLSETHDNLLMWAHYASDHRGYVIEIDSSYFFALADDPNNAWRVNLDRVKYREMRVLDQPTDWYEYFHGTHYAIATTKSTHWSHEQEWRMGRPLKDADAVLRDPNTQDILRDQFNNPCHLFSLPKKYLTKVIFGARSSKKHLGLVKKSLQQDPELAHVRLKLAVPDPVDFRLRFINMAIDDLPDSEPTTQ